MPILTTEDIQTMVNAAYKDAIIDALQDGPRDTYYLIMQVLGGVTLSEMFDDSTMLPFQPAMSELRNSGTVVLFKNEANGNTLFALADKMDPNLVEILPWKPVSAETTTDPRRWKLQPPVRIRAPLGTYATPDEQSSA